MEPFHSVDGNECKNLTVRLPCNPVILHLAFIQTNLNEDLKGIYGYLCSLHNYSQHNYEKMKKVKKMSTDR